MESATIQALANINDAARFERLATAVLRLDPKYGTLGHPGVNAEGATIKSPVDGITFTDNGNHLIAVHHTITSADSLERKWLLDPAKVKRRPTSKSPPPLPGDVLKTLEIVREERKRTPNLAATLVLTTNEELDYQLHLDVVAVGRAEQLDIDLWPRSRIAHLLDTDPVGQLVRRKLLGISEELISRELLLELSRENVEAFDAHDERSRRVKRALDQQLSHSRQPLTFVVGASGSGKTVAAHEALLSHVAAGGAGLVIQTNALDGAASIDQAIMTSLKSLRPSLAGGQSPTALFGEDDPILILVEDVSRSGQHQRIIERLASWVPKDDSRGGPGWRALCPVWPHLFGGISSQLRKQIDGMSLRPEPMSVGEAGAAVSVRAAAAGLEFDQAQAERIAEALGNDPLLIGLNTDWTNPSPDEVISRFVEEALERCAHTASWTIGDLRHSLHNLGGAMMRERRLDPSWIDIVGWNLVPEDMAALRALAQHAEVLRVEGHSADLRLRFRHDRVRDWLLVGAAVELNGRQELNDAIVSEPILTEIMAGLAVRTGAPPTFVSRLRSLSPLALFHGLRLSAPIAASTLRLVEAAKSWLDQAKPDATLTVRWNAIAAIEHVEAEWMLDLVRRFPVHWAGAQTARFRNGDLTGGLDMCSVVGLHTSVTWLRDAVGALKRRKFDETTAAIRGALDVRPLSPRIGEILKLAGIWGEVALAPSISDAWASDPTRAEHLEAFLWSAARCVTAETAHWLLDPICEAWAELPEESEEGNYTAARNDIAAHTVQWAFNRAPPAGAVSYFIQRAASPDLDWQIEYMMHGLDLPEAVVFEARCGANRLKSSPDLYFANSPARHHWERRQWDGEATMSEASRLALLAIWTDLNAEKELRIASFDLWAANHFNGDLDELRPAAGDADLADRILRERLERRDVEAVPELLPRLNGAKAWYWWQFARYVWSPDFHRALDEMLTSNAIDLEEDIGSSICRIIMRLPVPEAEALLLKHWDSFSRSSDFVVTALFVATPRLLERVAVALRASDEPEKCLKHIAIRYGIKTIGEPGVTREEQIWALKPYMAYLDRHQLYQLAEACNEMGWFEARQTVLDPSLPPDDVPSPERFKEQLDREVAAEHPWIKRFVDRELKGGVSWPSLIEILASWLPSQTSVRALEMAAQAIIRSGRRSDVGVLKHWGGENEELLSDTLTDVSYAVARRSAV